jgi:hypothetical protein
MPVRDPAGTGLAYHVGAHARRYLTSTLPPEHIKDRKHHADLCKLPVHIRERDL